MKPMKISLPLLILSAFFGLSGIMASAAGAHLISIHSAEERSMFQIATTIHLTHALLLAVFASLYHEKPTRHWFVAASTFTILGILLFCGSIYLYAFTQMELFLQMTPWGGAGLIFAWISFVIAVLVWGFGSRRQKTE